VWPSTCATALGIGPRAPLGAVRQLCRDKTEAGAVRSPPVGAVLGGTWGRTVFPVALSSAPRASLNFQVLDLNARHEHKSCTHVHLLLGGEYIPNPVVRHGSPRSRLNQTAAENPRMTREVVYSDPGAPGLLGDDVGIRRVPHRGQGGFLAHVQRDFFAV